MKFKFLCLYFVCSLVFFSVGAFWPDPHLIIQIPNFITGFLFIVLFAIELWTQIKRFLNAPNKDESL